MVFSCNLIALDKDKNAYLISSDEFLSAPIK
jgi:hypothetical protein